MKKYYYYTYRTESDKYAAEHNQLKAEILM